MAHLEARYNRGVLRVPGLLTAAAWCGWKALWVALVRVLAFRGIRGSETRVAVYRIGSIGDFMHALPALAAIRARHADAKITLVTNAVDGEPWAGRLGIDSALDLSIASYAGPAELREAVSGNECLYYLAPQPLGAWRAIRDMLFFARCGIRRARGFPAPTPRGWFARAQRPWRTARPQYEQLLKACKLAGPADWPELPVRTPEDAPGEPYVVLAPTGKFPTQHWSIERFIEIAVRLKERGVMPVWVGLPADSERVNAAGPAPGRAMFGELPFAVLRGLMRGARAVVANDSGLAHMAGALGTPLVVMSSARNASYSWRPPSQGQKVTLLRKDMNCEACHLRECSDVACIKLISVDEVWGYLAELLP